MAMVTAFPPRHDDFIKWEHSALLALCVGNSQVTGEFSQMPVTRILDVLRL